MDQSNFNLEQQLAQNTKEPEKAQVEESPVQVPEEKVVKPKLKPQYLILIGSLVFLFVLLVVLIVMSLVTVNQNPTVRPGPTPITLPKGPDKPQSEFELKLESIEQELNQADPSVIDLDPPPLNYQIVL